MIRKLTTVSIGVIVLAATVMAFRFVPGIFQATEGKISFRSEAQLELIKASSNGLVGLIDTARKNFTFKVAIRSFEGFNSRTQREHFNENYMQTEKYPEASFKGKIIEDIDLSHEGVYSVRAKGIMNIHGVEKERIIRAELTVRNNIITLQSNFSVLLSDHNIPIPKVVHQKLADEIKVEVNTALQPR